ncbi:MAG: PaeR7I family type II restriction endonuclease [Thermoguttaceae bacterium]
MDGFARLVHQSLIDCGCPENAIYHNSHLELPGFFRPEKRWDLIVLFQGNLLATVEFKSQIGPSFGNNFNNRTEEAVGNATDLWTAYREGVFPLSQKPWIGYLFLLEDCQKSTVPVKVKEPHFPVLPEFKNSSYTQRYEQFLTKLLRERLYDATCFLTSNSQEGKKGQYAEPVKELGFSPFIQSLTHHIALFFRR